MNSSVEAIVLKKTDYKENDRIITLLTKDRGRVDVSVRGARKPKSPLMAASEIFTLGEFVIAKGAKYETLASFTLIDSFYELRLDYELLSCASNMLVCAYTAAQKDEKSDLLFELLKRSLIRLSKRESSPDAALCAFLLHFSNVEGFKPRLNHCAKCERRLSDNENGFLDIEEGGLICKDCIKSAHIDYRLSASQTMWLRNVLQYGISKTGEISDVPLTALKSYVSHYIDRKLPKA